MTRVFLLYSPTHVLHGDAIISVSFVDTFETVERDAVIRGCEFIAACTSNNYLVAIERVSKRAVNTVRADITITS